MAQFHPDWLEHQRKRWLRHDRQRYVRPDGGDLGVHLYAPPGDANLDREAVAARDRALQPMMTTDEAATCRRELLEAKALAAELQWQLTLRRFARKYRPDQARDERGRWVDEGSRRPSTTVSGEQPLPSTLAGTIIRICTAGSRSLSIDQWGNKSHRVLYECAGGRSFIRSGAGHRFPGFVLDPFQ
jgi:hypothetical protein